MIPSVVIRCVHVTTDSSQSKTTQCRQLVERYSCNLITIKGFNQLVVFVYLGHFFYNI